VTRAAAITEPVRRIGVQVLAGALIAFAIVYPPLIDALRHADTVRALDEVFGGGSQRGDPLLSPGLWKALFVGIGLLTAGGVYWSFEVRWRAVIVVGSLSLIGVVVTLDYARGATWIVFGFAAIAASMALTVWHDRWLGGYIEDTDDA
jgi:hypothetical protein